MDDLQFEWDAEKAGENLAKHGVSFEEAATVFFEDLGRIDDDPDHSIGEHRELLFGRSAAGRLLVISFTERGDAIRIINARRMTHYERERYEEDSL